MHNVILPILHLNLAEVLYGKQTEHPVSSCVVIELLNARVEQCFETHPL